MGPDGTNFNEMFGLAPTGLRWNVSLPSPVEDIIQFLLIGWKLYNNKMFI